MFTTTNAATQSQLRKRGRPLSANKQLALREILPKYLLALPDHPISQARFRELLAIDQDTPVQMEIGFGAGEHLAKDALMNPEICFIGIEVFQNGIAALVSKIVDQAIANIRIVPNDAALLCAKIPDGCIDFIKLPFADPWPKTRHHKRRFINQQNLAQIHRILRPEGRFLFITDHIDYANWSMEQTRQFGKLDWTAQCCADWYAPHKHFHGSRYYDKALSLNKKPVFLEFIRPENHG